jgi:hypothetical protein
MRVVSGGVRHKATEIRIHVHGEKGDPMKIRQFEFKNVDGDLKRVCQFHANVAGKSMKILMPDGIHSKKIVLKFDDAIKKDTV